jgi:neutral ceramidase
MTRTVVRLALLATICLSAHERICFGAGWQAGTAKVAITPREPVWMAGYGARDKPSEGAVHDLWAKALALKDPSGRLALIVSLDVCGIDRATSRRIRDAFKRAHGLSDDAIVLACSHTHCGPVVGETLITMYQIDDAQKARIKEYTATLVKDVEDAAAKAIGSIEPVDVAWDTGRADFAVNRRNNKEPDVPSLRARVALEGPVDHDVPVLRLIGRDKKVRAVVFGYACHCTVLGFNKFCGDYAGFAQIALESRYPGAQAMFVAGCGADQNPLPRRTVELAEAYGNQLAEAVARVVDSPMRPISGPLVSAYEEIPLKLGTLPTREQIEADAKSSTFAVANRARKLLRTLDTDGRLAPTYPYPVQVWRLGDLTWVLLGGEVVVDYSLRLKRNLGSSQTWVSGYCNDVMAYIPSLRVLKEGGYEGATAMIYYGLPASWSTDVETQIIDTVDRLVGTVEASK